MTQVADKPTTAVAARPQANLPVIRSERLPYHPAIQERFGIGRAEWRALVEAVYPLAQSIDSVILALSYCKARRLDPFKRVIHIVPIWDSKQGRMVDTIWPGIGELRTTAMRTKEYAGRDRTEFGPDITKQVGKETVTFPEWAQDTVYRMIDGVRVAFAGPQVYWLETYAERGGKDRDKTPNTMWLKRPRGQLAKCSEAAALRAAFPEEIGNEYIAEEAHVSSGPAAREVESTVKAHGGSASDQVARMMGAVADPVHAEALADESQETVEELESTEVLEVVDAAPAQASPPEDESLPDKKPAAKPKSAKPPVDRAKWCAFGGVEGDTDESYVARMTAALKRCKTQEDLGVIGAAVNAAVQAGHISDAQAQTLSDSMDHVHLRLSEENPENP